MYTVGPLGAGAGAGGAGFGAAGAATAGGGIGATEGAVFTTTEVGGALLAADVTGGSEGAWERVGAGAVMDTAALAAVETDFSRVGALAGSDFADTAAWLFSGGSETGFVAPLPAQAVRKSGTNNSKRTLFHSCRFMAITITSICI